VSPSRDDGWLADIADTPATARARAHMVSQQLRRRNITDERVLAALATVPRHAFVPPELRAHAYDDGALPIGEGQTISQPYIVALMTQLLAVRGGERVLEIGTGSGYQSAVLAELAAAVYSVEIHPELVECARAALAALGYTGVRIRVGDGASGWSEAAPFDALIVTAAVPQLPEALIEQVRDEGRVVAPLERSGGEELALGIKHHDGVEWTYHGGVRFVPMTGAVRAPEGRRTPG
jgi:protein-L-isoaspartate(D-aspartate) O-methyltransferase